MSWRYIATRLNGDGTESIIDNELPLSGVSLTTALSGPDGLTATISPEVARLKGEDGLPLILPWSTAIYAEADGLIRHGTIVESADVDNEALAIQGVGFTGYLNRMPYTSERSRIQTDPLTEARHMWAHVQVAKDGDLGLVLDSTTSPVRIGTKEKDVNFQTSGGDDVSFTAGPYVLAWYQTDDLGSEFDKLAKETPFDYWMQHAWDGDTISHRLRLSYPGGGRRRTDLRFAVGENVSAVPGVDFSGDDYASEVMVLGAGEGRKMVRGSASRPSGRLRRVAVVPDKAQRAKSSATKAAEVEVARRLGGADVTDVMVSNHPHAPLGSWSVGDDIFVQGDVGWAGDLGLWVRIVSSTISPDESDNAILTVLRSDKVEA